MPLSLGGIVGASPASLRGAEVDGSAGDVEAEATLGGALAS